MIIHSEMNPLELQALLSPKEQFYVDVYRLRNLLWASGYLNTDEVPGWIWRAFIECATDIPAR